MYPHNINLDTGINGSPEEQLTAFGNRTETSIKWLLQLMTSIEADGFVGTRNVSFSPQNNA